MKHLLANFKRTCLRVIVLSMLMNTLAVFILNAQEGGKVKEPRVLSLDIVTTPGMVFIPVYSNLPNYLIDIGAKSEFIGLNIEWVRPRSSFNKSALNSFFTFGISARAIGLNWREDGFNHALENDIKALDIAYFNVFMGGKFIFRGFEQGALNFTFGPGLLMGPAVQNDNVKDGIFMTLGIDLSVTFSYDLSKH